MKSRPTGLRFPHYAIVKNRSRFQFERLEDRRLLTASLSLAGTQTLVAGTNIDASVDHASQQQNMSIDINPTNPLHVTGVSERNTPTTGTSLGLYRSSDGGLTWATTTIDNSVDSFGAASMRFDPVLGYDASGNLFVAYGVDDATTTRLVVLVSGDDGATFTQTTTVDSVADLIGSINRFNLATGADGLGHQAVYVAYSKTTVVLRQIVVAGSNDGGVSFTGPVAVSDTLLDTVTNGDPAVGPTGQLYVSWFNSSAAAVNVDVDSDGLFIATNSFGADITVVDNSTPRPTAPGNFNLFSGQSVPAQPTHGISTNSEMDIDADGQLFIAFVDLFSAVNNDSNVYVARSINQGANWTLVPVAIGSGVTEFNPWVDIDPTSGSVNVLYYSTLGDTATGNDDVNVELATSIDIGLTYTSNQQLTSAPSRASAILGGNDFGDYNGLAVRDGTIQGMWSDNRGPSLEAEAFTASASFSSATAGNVLSIPGTAGDDAVIIRRSAANPAFVEVLLNGQLQYAGLLATLDNTLVNTADGSDMLTIDNADGVVPTLITFDGGASAGDHDTLVLTGNPGAAVARETYLAGATPGTGTWVLDPDGSRGAGLNASGNGDELTVTFSNLEPVDSDVPAVVFDVILNAADNNATIQDGGMINGANALEVHDNSATFESARFANKLTARIMGEVGVDTLAADYTTASAGLLGLELYGHVAPDVLGQPADDNVGDLLSVLRNAAAVAHLLEGNGGDDLITVGNGDLTNILSPVTVIGDAGTDSLVVDDSVRATDVDYFVDATTVAICTDPGPPPVHNNIAFFDTTADKLEQVRLNATQGINRFDVTPNADTGLFIDGNEPHVLPGDYLSIRFDGTTGRTLTFTNQATGTGMWEFTNRQTVMFDHIERFNYFPVLVYSAEAAVHGKPTVKIVDADSGTVITSFLAYESTYTQGVRVAVGDVTGDGIPEIITAPGRGHTSQIKIFSINGVELAGFSFTAYANSFKNGVNLAVGDVNGDGLNDLVTVPTRGKAEVHTYLNQSATNPATPFDNGHRNTFLAYDKSYIGGASVAVGDVTGTPNAEIIIGSGAGIRNDVRIFDGAANASATTTAPILFRFFPYAANQRGGVNVAVANIDADSQMEIVAAAGIGGQSQIKTFDITDLNVPVNTFFGVYTGNGSNAQVRTAALTRVDGGGNLVTDIFTVQGPDGKSQHIRRTSPAGPVVDFLMETDTEFRNGFYVAGDINAIAPFLC